MKTVKFTHFHAENFGKFQEPIQHELGNRVLISGANGVGKSTIKRMIMYVLGTKDENGKEISGIRPHDENGVDIDGLTTVAELTVSVDGAENTLKRICFQEKNRQGEYTGKDNLQYFVDDVKKGTKKAYDEYIQAVIPNPICISAYELLSKDTDTRRKLLEDTFGTHSNDDVIDMHPEYEELRGKLRANTPRDLKSALRKKRDGYKEGGKKVPGLIDEREKVIHQIEFEQSQKVDIDLAELELLKNSLNEQIAENKEKQASVDRQFEEYDKQSKDILDLQFALSDLERKANEENNHKKAELDDKITDIQISIKRASNNALICQNNIETEAANKEFYQRGIEEERGKYKNASSTEFNSDELICPMCKREYGEDKQKELKENFQKTKDEMIAKITESGNRFKKEIEDCEKKIEIYEKSRKQWEDTVAKLRESLKPLTEELSALPQSIDISDREDVKQLKQQIADKEQAMQKGNSASEIREKLNVESVELQRKKVEIELQFIKAAESNKIDERVEQLRKEQMKISQEIADVDRELALLKDFERQKAQILEQDVNSHFSIIKWRMFKELQNGELGDICSPFVNGTSYDGNLNFSSKLLAEVDICTAFQRIYDVQTPILLDNCESISSNRLPDIPNQLIMFRVPYIPEKPLAPKEGMTEEEWKKAVEEWEEEKKRLEEYYSELRIECLEG